MDPITLNCAIIEAFGLDPHSIRADATIRLDKQLGPIITVEHILRNDEGHMYAIGNELATVLRQYKLVPVADDPMICPACGLPKSEVFHNCKTGT